MQPDLYALYLTSKSASKDHLLRSIRTMTTQHAELHFYLLLQYVFFFYVKTSSRAKSAAQGDPPSPAKRGSWDPVSKHATVVLVVSVGRARPSRRCVCVNTRGPDTGYKVPGTRPPRRNSRDLNSQKRTTTPGGQDGGRRERRARATNPISM